MSLNKFDINEFNINTNGIDTNTYKNNINKSDIDTSISTNTNKVMKKTTLSSLYGGPDNISKNILNLNNQQNSIYVDSIERLSQQKFLDKYNITNATFTNSKVSFLSNETAMHIIHSYYATNLPFYISSWNKVSIFFQDELDHYLNNIRNEKDNRVIFHSSNTHIFTYQIDPYFPNKNTLKQDFSILSVNLRRRKSNSDSKFIFSNSIDNNINLLNTYKHKYLEVLNNQLNKSTNQFDDNYIFKMPINKYTLYVFIPKAFQTSDYFIYLTDEIKDATSNIISSTKGYFNVNISKSYAKQTFTDSCKLLLSLDPLKTLDSLNSLKTSNLSKTNSQMFSKINKQKMSQDVSKLLNKNKFLFIKKIEDYLSQIGIF